MSSAKLARGPRGGTIIGALQSIPKTIRAWQDNRESLLHLATGVSAALVVVAITADQKPSDSLAAVAHGVGATPVAKWLGPDAPPALAAGSPTVHYYALLAALLLFIAMVVVPLWRTLLNNLEFGTEQLRLFLSPAASTVWFLLLVAAQQGDLGPTLQHWETMTLRAAFWTIGGLLIMGLLYLTASHYLFRGLLKWLALPPAVLALQIGIGIIAAIGAILFAGASLPLSIIIRMSAMQPSQTRDVDKGRNGIRTSE